jgi:hypothetical protein
MENIFRRELRVLLETYCARDDLIRAFPEAVRGDLHRLLTWAITWGTTVDRAKPLLEPYREQFSKLLEEVREQKVHALVIEAGDRQTKRLKEALDRMTKALMQNQKSTLTEILKRDQKIKELEFQIAQLNSSLALRLVRRVPFGSRIGKLSFFLPISRDRKRV